MALNTQKIMFSVLCSTMQVNGVQRCIRVQTDLNPLFAVYLHAVGPQRADGSVNDLLHHLCVTVGLLQLGGCDPDMPVCGDVFTSFVQNPTSVLVRF